MTDSLPELVEQLTAHRDAISRYIRGMVRDPAAAEDLAQETLLRAHRKLTTLEDPRRLIPWLYRIATNLSHDRFRQASWREQPASYDRAPEDTREPSPVDTAVDPAPRLDTVMEQREMSTCVQEYLAGLSDGHRAVMLLHDVEGLTNPEIAAMLGVSLATVKIRLHRARERLRAALAAACAFSTDARGVLGCERKPPVPEP